MLKTYATGSSGNFYEVNDGTTKIMLECGLRFNKLQTLCGFKITDFAACIVSHEHKDHSQAVNQLSARGIPVYMTAGTATALKLEAGPFLHLIKPLQMFTIGTLVIKPFPTEHDALEPVGFLIMSKTTREKLMFATDTRCIRYKFRGVDEMAIECNYADELITQSHLPAKICERIRCTHMSLESTKKFLSACDLNKTKKIHLIHLSENHAYGDMFRAEIEQMTGITTVIGGQE